MNLYKANLNEKDSDAEQEDTEAQVESSNAGEQII